MVMIKVHQTEVGAPGKSHSGVLDRAGELYEFASRNHETDLSLGPSLLFGYGGHFGCIWVVWGELMTRGVGEELLLDISRD